MSFDSGSFTEVKDIGVKVKGFFRRWLKYRKEIVEDEKRLDELNKNIIEEMDFSRKDTFEDLSG